MPRQPTGRPRGRPRKPTAVLELHGSYREHPGRRRTREPKLPVGLGDPPALTRDGQRLWEQLAPIAERHGASSCDAAALAELVETLQLTRAWRVRATAEILGAAGPTPGAPPTFHNYDRARRLFVDMCGRFGFLPAERVRLLGGETDSGVSDLLSG